MRRGAAGARRAGHTLKARSPGALLATGRKTRIPASRFHQILTLHVISFNDGKRLGFDYWQKQFIKNEPTAPAEQAHTTRRQ